MPYWLCEERREQRASYIQRFDPRFWTVNFPRPMMASVVTTAADALRVEAVFYHRDALAGLIWDSVDTLDHPLLAYATDRNYARTTLRFRWRSQGIVPLNAVNGPTLTIEGRNAAGEAKTWYVRLWNYAQGKPDDAEIALPFSALSGGFLLPGEADPVHPEAIDRMFIALVPSGYQASGGRFAEPVDAWVELTGIACTGHRPMLTIGDVLVPPHGLSIATAYDDSFNQTPARLLRTVRGLGYRGLINHYVGMSHYFELAAEGDAMLVASREGRMLNRPTIAWHRDFALRCTAMGAELIVSLSYELFDAHCPESWKQRSESGAPALTGWSPPSALLSPAKDHAMAYLQAVARAFVEISAAAGQPVRFQIGEPWWWITPEGEICLYDAAARQAFGSLLVSIPSIRGTQNAAQRAMLDKAGELLAASTAALAQAVRDAAGQAGAEILILVYLPTVLDSEAPEARRANVPTGWAFPAFDVLQLEDYDWVSVGNFSAQRRGLASMQARLGYPLAHQHYLSGFVLTPDDRDAWRPIASAAEQAKQRGVAATFVWALPQIARDGFTFFEILDTEENAVQAFDDVLFPLAIGRDASIANMFQTEIFTSVSGHERRNSQWADARLSFDAGPGIRSESDLGTLIAFFRARRGAARGFRFRDPLDHSSNAMTGEPNSADQLLGKGDGQRTRFALVKHYGPDDDPQVRRITRPVADSLLVEIGGQANHAWTLLTGGEIEFDTPPPQAAEIRAGFVFDVPVRFAEDRLDANLAGFLAGEMVSVPLIELREDA